jgi:hypothetical protein
MVGIRAVMVMCAVAWLSMAALPHTDYPVPPRTKQLLFYVQNSTNINTVIYDVNAVKGVIESDEPVKIYWLRFADHNKLRPLNYLEKTFAYGLKSEAQQNGRVKATFLARKEKQLEVYIDEQGQATALTTINAKMAKLTRLFVQVSEDGWWPKVSYVEFFGIDVQTNLPVYEKLIITS